MTNLDQIFLQSLSGAATMVVEHDGRELARVPLPSSARAVASLRACEAEVMRDWGFDPDVIRSLRQRPKPLKAPPSWFRDSDYPMEAVRARISGSVLTRLMVGVDGRVSECIIVEGSGSALLDQRTCQLLVKRGRYEPAITAAGSKVKAMTSIRIHWRLPGG